MAATPPKPLSRKPTELGREETKKTLDRTVKTPFQIGTSYQRSFRSEIQPNKVVNRFNYENTNARTNLRYNPSTSHHRSQTGAREANTSKISSNPFLSRLGNSIGMSKKAKDEPKRTDKQTAPNLIDFKRTPAPIGTITPAVTIYQQPKTQQLKSQQPAQIRPESAYQRHLLSTSTSQKQQPPQLLNPQIVPLATATKAPLPKTPFSKGPLGTVTKPPLSVSQYTQPTPGPNNRSTNQLSRAQSEPNIKYQVNVNDKTYKILRKIGSGGSAKVYEGFEPQTSQTVAIKIINVAQADRRTQDSYFNEKALLTKLLDSKHVVKIYDSEYKSNCKELVIVMEKGDADLSQVIDSYFKTKYDTQNTMIDGIFIKFYWRGMVQAVNDIHQHGIVHSDLKPVNFILVRNEIKLIDFGIASAIEPEGTSIIKDYQIGTINYMAPEALRNRAADASFQYLQVENDENNQHKRTLIKYNSKVDIWSLGCILYNLVYGRPPFDKYKDVISKVQAITDPNHLINFPEISNRNLLNCMQSCLRYNPADRPTAKELLNDSYLKEDIVTLQK